MSISAKHITVVFFVFSWFSFLIYQGCKSEQSDEIYINKDESSFVGSDACKSCHQVEYNDWIGSHHEKAMMHATDSTVLGDFNNVSFESKDITTTFYKKGNEYRIKTQKLSDVREYKITHTFGWEPLQQYLVEFPDGKLQAFHIAWDTGEKRWYDLYPDDDFDSEDWMHWTKGSMTWNKMCADCHSTNLQKNYSSETGHYSTSWSQINVSCESCHGAGEAHVNLAKSKNYQSGINPSLIRQVSSDPAIVQIENCAPCHSRRSSLGTGDLFNGRFLDHYTPDILRTNLYFPDGQILEEDYVYGSFVQSKMFQNGVKCTDCHNPHTAELKRSGNSLCTSCHTESYNRPEHTFHPEETESSLCISCHMPGRTYMGNDFRRDHSFRVPRPDQSINFGTPNACIGCHDDKSNEWASKAIEQWYGLERSPHFSDILVHGPDPDATNELIALAKDLSEPGIARATAVDFLANIPSETAYQSVLLALKDRDALVRVSALQNLIQLQKEDRIQFAAPLLNDPIRSVRVAAALVLADLSITEIPIRYQENFSMAYEELMTKLNHNIDFSSGQMQMAQLYDRKGNAEQAILAYRKTLTMDSLMPGVRINLARLYSMESKTDEAVDVLQTAVAINPENVHALYALGLILAEVGRGEEAILYFTRAAEIVPGDLRIYYNWGLMLHQLSKSEEAVDVFRNALSINSNADDIRYAMITVLISMGNKQKALEEAKILANKYPQNREIAAMVQQLEQD